MRTAELGEKHLEKKDRPRDDEVFIALAEDEAAQLFLESVDERIVERFTPQEKGTVLQLGCSTEKLTAGIIDKSMGSTRLVVVDPRLPLLDAVRFKTSRAYPGKVFFNSKFEWKRLPFDDEVFVSVVSPLFWTDAPDRESLLVDVYRVLHHAGAVLLSTYMKDSFREFYDLYAETLAKFDMLHVVPALQAEQASLLDEAEATALLEDHGFSMCRVLTFELPMEFSGSKDLLSSPLVNALWISRWNAIGGEEAERILWHLREAIDRYFAARPMRLTIRIGLLSGLK